MSDGDEPLEYDWEFLIPEPVHLSCDWAKNVIGDDLHTALLSFTDVRERPDIDVHSLINSGNRQFDLSIKLSLN